MNNVNVKGVILNAVVKRATNYYAYGYNSYKHMTILIKPSNIVRNVGQKWLTFPLLKMEMISCWSTVLNYNNAKVSLYGV